MLNLLFLLFVIVISAMVTAFNRAEAAARRQEEKAFYRAASAPGRQKSAARPGDHRMKAAPERRVGPVAAGFQPEFVQPIPGRRRPERVLAYSDSYERRSA